MSFSYACLSVLVLLGFALDDEDTSLLQSISKLQGLEHNNVSVPGWLRHVGLGEPGWSCDKVCEDFGTCDPSLEAKMHDGGATALMHVLATKFNRVCATVKTGHSHGNSPYTHPITGNLQGRWCSAGNGRSFDCAKAHPADQRYCLCFNPWISTTTTTQRPQSFEDFSDRLAKGTGGQSCDTVCASHNSKCDDSFVSKIYATGKPTDTMKKIAAHFDRSCSTVKRNHGHKNSPYTHRTGSWCSAGKPPHFQCKASHPADERFCLCTGSLAPPVAFAAFDHLALGEAGQSCTEACEGADGCDDSFESQISKTSDSVGTIRAIAKHFGRECKTVRGNHGHHNSPYTHEITGYQKGTWCSVGDGSSTADNCFRKHQNDMRYCLCNKPWTKHTTVSTTAIIGVANTVPVELAAGGAYCLVTGDPHVKAFDSPNADQMCLGPMGDYWLVNSEKLKIQARYLGRERHDGYAWVKGLVIAGSLLGDGHPKIHIPVVNSGVIEYEVGKVKVPMIITADKQTSYNNGEFTIEVKRGPLLNKFIDNPDPNDKRRRDTVFIKFHKEDVLIIINQGTIQHVLISAAQSVLAGTTGQCGNFNGNPLDDTFKVDDCPGRSSECLFPAANCPNPEDGKPRVPENCPAQESDFYHKICTKYHKDPKPWTIFNCKTDCCASRTTCPDKDNEGMTATCILRGDPHIKTWDADKPDKHVYGPLGDYWLVKNEYLQIQGRYKSNRNDQRAQIMGVAISGPLLGPAPYPVLYIPAEGDGVVTEYISGEANDQILCLKNCAVPSFSFTKGDYYDLTYGDGTNIRKYFDNEHAVQGNTYTLNFFARNTNAKIVVATITINQGAIQAVKVTAEEWLLHNVGGQCGNFNGDQTDDHSDAIADLVVNTRGFPTYNDQTGDKVAAIDCPQAAYHKAIHDCRNYHPSATNEDVILNCALDCCTGPCELDGLS